MNLSARNRRSWINPKTAEWRSAGANCTLTGAGRLSQPVEHRLRDQRNAVVGALEAPRVLGRIFADDHAFRNVAAAVDHHARQARVAADGDARQQHRLAQFAIGVDAAAREQQRAVDVRAGNDAAAGDQRIHRHAAPVVAVEHELGRRQLFLVGPDRPVGVVHVERRLHGGQIDVGFPVGVDGADVAPVRLRCCCRW